MCRAPVWERWIWPDGEPSATRRMLTINDVNNFSTCRGRKKKKKSQQQLETQGCTMQLCTKGMTVFTGWRRCSLQFCNNLRIERILITHLALLFIMTVLCIVNVQKWEFPSSLNKVTYKKKKKALLFFGAINVPHSHKQRRKRTPTA